MKLLRLVLLLFSTWFWLTAVAAPEARADAPVFAPSALTVDKSTTYLTDIVQYTVKLDNTAGTADALDVVFTDALPRGLDVQLFSLDGIPQPLSLLTDGLYVGTVAAGTTRTITILGVVTAIPIRPAAAQYANTAAWTYRYRPTPGASKVNSSFKSNSATTNVIRLETTMSLATVALPAALNLGTEITYTLTIQNTGNVNVTDATLTNAIPVGAVYRAGTTTLNGTTLADLAATGPFVAGYPINSSGRPPGRINAGETATVVFKVTSLTLPVINVAAVDADGTLGPTPPINVRATTQTQTADLSLTLSDGQTSVVAGNPITYTFTVKNNSGVTLDSVQINDDLPATLLDTSWTPSSGSYAPSSGTWTGLSLAAGMSATLTLAAKISPFATGTLTYSAAVAPPSGLSDPTTTNNSATDSDTLTSVADLAVVQLDGASSVAAGAPLQYTITVSNNGPSAVTNLTLTDSAPPTLQNPVFVADEGTYVPTSGAWTGVSLSAGQSVRLTLSGTVSPAASGAIANTVAVAPPSGTSDPTSANNTTTDTNAIITPSSLRLTLVQVVDKVKAKPGDVLTYTITYRNNSTELLSGVGIRNAVPANTTFLGADYGMLPDGVSGCAVISPTVGSNGTIAWNFGGVLSPGLSGKVSFQVRVK